MLIRVCLAILSVVVCLAGREQGTAVWRERVGVQHTSDELTCLVGDKGICVKEGSNEGRMVCKFG